MLPARVLRNLPPAHGRGAHHRGLSRGPGGCPVLVRRVHGVLGDTRAGVQGGCSRRRPRRRLRHPRRPAPVQDGRALVQPLRRRRLRQGVRPAGDGGWRPLRAARSARPPPLAHHRGLLPGHRPPRAAPGPRRAQGQAPRAHDHGRVHLIRRDGRIRPRSHRALRRQPQVHRRHLGVARKRGCLGWWILRRRHGRGGVPAAHGRRLRVQRVTAAVPGHRRGSRHPPRLRRAQARGEGAGVRRCASRRGALRQSPRFHHRRRRLFPDRSPASGGGRVRRG
mmetsp:Transcript_10250/g.47055  ORF Transcript_10250/g.47055 Transcript_10250/m.47055 type:complete len:279 (-) Transcript_10250:1923-2759(-)